MSKRGALLIALLFVLLLPATALGLVGCGSQTDNKPVKIAFVLPLTTANALIGASMKTGAEMAVQDLNGSGGIKGRKVELQLEDNADTNDIAVNALNKALAEKPAGLLVGSTSSQSMAMSPIIQKEKLPTMILGSSPTLTNHGNPYFFSPRVTDEFAAIGAVKFAVQGLGKKKIAVFHAAEEFGTSVAPIIQAELKNQGLTPVVVVPAPSADKDYTPQLLKIKDSGADALLAWVLPAPAVLLEQQMKQLKINIPVIANPVLALSSTLKLMKPEDLAGSYSLTDSLPDKSTEPTVQLWSKKYVDKYKSDPDLFAPMAYDGVMMLAKNIEKVGSTDSDALRKALAETKGYQGIGNVYNADEKGRLAKRMVIVDVSSGSPKFVQYVGDK